MSDEMTSATFTEQEWSHFEKKSLNQTEADELRDWSRFEAKTLNEECGLFGVWGHPDAARLTYFGLHALQPAVCLYQGDGSGAASGDLQLYRRAGVLSAPRRICPGRAAAVQLYAISRSAPAI